METAVAVTTKTPPLPVVRAKCGAPTLYREEYPEMLVEFFEAAKLPATPAPDAIDPPSGKGSHKAALMQVYDTLPTFEGFGRLIGVTTKCLGEWAQRHPAFGQAYARAKDVQRQHFSIGLVTGAMNPTGAIFAAKNLIGWRDKIDIEQTSSADAAGMSDLKAMMQQATPDELATFSGLLDTWQKRAAAQSIAAPASS